MKNCDEMVNCLFERRERYDAERKKKKAAAVRAAASVCCVCFIALLGVAVWGGGTFRATAPDQTAGNAVYSGTQNSAREDHGEAPANSAADDRIVIHPVNEIPTERKNGICLWTEDFVEMTREEMIGYYGMDYVPDVPADLKPWEAEPQGIFRRNGGTGEVYWDTVILNYSNGDFTRNVHLVVDKGSRVLQDCYRLEEAKEKSVINNVEIFMGVTDGGYYYAEFIYKGVGFLFEADGVTQEEFIAMTASVLN